MAWRNGGGNVRFRAVSIRAVGWNGSAGIQRFPLVCRRFQGE